MKSSLYFPYKLHFVLLSLASGSFTARIMLGCIPLFSFLSCII